jgi:hypothetical protein
MAGKSGLTLSHLTNQECWPVGVIELLGKCRGGLEIRHPENLVVATLEGDTHLRQLPTQPLAAIDVNLSGVRRPSLDTHVHPAKNRVDQIPVQVQAAAITPDDFQTLCLTIAGDGERDARFYDREDADQAFADAVLLGDGPGHRFLRSTAGVRVRGGEEVVGTSRLFGGRLGVLDERSGFAFEELPGILEQHAPLGKVATKRAIWKHRGQVPLEDDPVKSFDHTQD